MWTHESEMHGYLYSSNVARKKQSPSAMNYGLRETKLLKSLALSWGC